MISAGQYIHRKGFDILIKSLKNTNDNIMLYIIGGKPPENYIQLCKEESVVDRVKFIDFQIKEELLKYFKAADIFVLPTREDAWGLVVNEAMACGLPIITTKKCGAGMELITNNKNGLLVDPNENDISNAINTLMKEDLNRIAMNNILKIKKYTIENMVDTHINILKKMKEKENE